MVRHALSPFVPAFGFLLGVLLVAAGAAAVFWPAGLIVAGAGLVALFYEPPERGGTP